MGTSNIKQADKKGRVAIPDFANATIIVEKLSSSEYLIKKAKVIPESDLEFHEELPVTELTAKDAAWFLDLLDHPPEPNAAATGAAKEFMKNNGRKMGNRKTEK